MMKNVIKLIFLLFDLVIGCCVLLHAQVDEKLKADIVSTGYVHSPLPLDETKAFETFGTAFLLIFYINLQFIHSLHWRLKLPIWRKQQLSLPSK